MVKRNSSIENNTKKITFYANYLHLIYILQKKTEEIQHFKLAIHSCIHTPFDYMLYLFWYPHSNCYLLWTEWVSVSSIKWLSLYLFCYNCLCRFRKLLKYSSSFHALSNSFHWRNYYWLKTHRYILSKQGRNSFDNVDS